MKKLGILLMYLSVLILSCAEKPKKIEEPVDDFLAVPKYEATTEKPEPVSTPTYVPSSYGSSYWYVVMDDEMNDGSNILWHRAIELQTSYFDFIEAKKQIPDAKGKCYFEFIIQINKESYDSFKILKAENESK